MADIPENATATGPVKVDSPSNNYFQQNSANADTYHIRSRNTNTEFGGLGGQAFSDGDLIDAQLTMNKYQQYLMGSSPLPAFKPITRPNSSHPTPSTAATVATASPPHIMHSNADSTARTPEPVKVTKEQVGETKRQVGETKRQVGDSKRQVGETNERVGSAEFAMRGKLSCEFNKSSFVTSLLISKSTQAEEHERVLADEQKGQGCYDSRFEEALNGG